MVSWLAACENVRAAVELAPELAALVAVTVADTADAEAVNSPLLEIVPPFADQITATLLVPFTVALNCCEPPRGIWALVGEI